MSQMLNMDNIYCTFPAEKLEKVSVRLEKEVPILADGYTVDSCEKAINLIGEELSQCDREYVAVLNLASDLRPINCSIVSVGTLNRSLVAPGDMVKTAILSNAANMLMIHTHPSGSLEPSDMDIMITKKMIFVCELVGVPLLDHIIIGGNNTKEYYSFREMICADTVEAREKALDKILPFQQSDFKALYEALEGNPVTIRFLDPPLHEFVPHEEAEQQKLADATGKTLDEVKAIVESLKEFNPMMGHRGCRLAVTYPEIAKMQTKAVIRAALEVQAAYPDWNVKPEIMIPLTCEVKELKFVKKVVVETADAEIAAAGAKLEYEVGTMIEIPRAALTADEIAKEADFFCFGTNDLTQMTFGFSRDDAGKFLNAYYDTKIFENDPFAKLDQNGVGKLMEMAIKLGKPVNPSLHCGMCGEHGGDPSSVEFCHKIGLDYVSCSPFRVPVARLAAAQAAIAEKNA